VLVDGVSVGAVDSYTFEDVAADHTIAATFTINTFTITATAGTGGSIDPTGAVSVNYGDDQIFTITPNTGYHILDVLVDGVSVGAVDSYTFEDVAADHTIAATFTINTFTITATAGTGGTIDPTGAVSVSYGEDQAFTITPNTGYHILDVLVDGVSVGAVDSYTFEDVAADHTIAASFAINTYTITATAGTGGTIDPTGTVSVNYGDDQIFTITPNTGYHILDVLVDGASVGAVDSYTFEDVAADHTIAASFAINTYLLTVQQPTGGSITPPTGSYDYGTVVELTATADPGYSFTGWTGDCSGTEPICSVTMDANKTVSATFTINTFTITATAGTGGSIDPTGAVSVSYGEDQAFTITPNTGYHILDVLVDGVSVGAVDSYTFEDVAADHTIAASFAINTYTITATAGTGGTIDPTGTVSVNYGDDQIFTITPNTGYHILDVLVDGVSVGALDSYTFPNVQADHTIAASFEETPPNTYTITATAGANGSISPSGSVTVTEGDDQVFTITRTRATISWTCWWMASRWVR
jgi:uncharacterized repeat protein (TIGR02543 family)